MTVSELRSAQRALSSAVVGVFLLALAGCMGSPTYGTDKTANAQLLEDLSGAFSIGLGATERNEIDYKPRPALVKPETTAVLPSPQDSVTASTSMGWPESPEQRLARVRAEATANRDNPAYRSNVINDIKAAEDMTPGEQQQAYRQQRASMASSSANRRFLSEPPLDYRQPSATAPVGELGESEDRKERAAEREAKKRKKDGKVTAGPITPVVIQ